MLKKCKGCDEVKGVSEFYPVAKGRPAPYCKVCDKARASRWAKANREHRRVYSRAYWTIPANKARHVANRLKRELASPRIALGAILGHAVKRVKTEYPVTLNELMSLWKAQNGLCAVSGIPMTWKQKAITATSVSVDRIDPTGGYSFGNVRLVCFAVNAFKGRMTDDQMLAMARAIVNKAEGDAQAVCRDGLQDLYAPLAKWQELLARLSL